MLMSLAWQVWGFLEPALHKLDQQLRAWLCDVIWGNQFKSFFLASRVPENLPKRIERPVEELKHYLTRTEN